MNIAEKDLPEGFKEKLKRARTYSGLTYGKLLVQYWDWNKFEEDVKKKYTPYNWETDIKQKEEI